VIPLQRQTYMKMFATQEDFAGENAKAK
jgi:hypothetical protein